MWNFKSSLAWGLLKKTAAFTGYRAGIFLGTALCYALLAWIGSIIGVAITRGAMNNGADFGTIIALARTMPPLFMILLCGSLGIGMWFLRKHLYWYVRVPHMALMAEILEGRRLPEGSQIKAGMEIVKARYGDMNRLWALRGQVEKTLPAINPLLPLRALFRMKPEGKGVGINTPYLWLAERPMDEMVLAHGLRKRAVNPYAAAREGLVLLAQNGKPVVGNALTLQGLGWAYTLLAFVAWLVIFAPFILLAPGAGLLVVIISCFFAWGTKAGLIDPFTNACLLQIYIGATRGQRPNPDWEARLDTDSEAFAELGKEAATLPGGADRTTATAQKTVIGGALPADEEAAASPAAPAAHAAPAAAATAATMAVTIEEKAAASAFAPPPELMPSGFVPPKPAPVPVAEAPAAEAPAEPTPAAPPPAASAPAPTPEPEAVPPAPAPVATEPTPEPAPSQPAEPPAPTPEPDPAPVPQPAHPPTPPETPADPPDESPVPTPPEVPQPEPPQEVPPATPPELPPETADAELPPLTAEDAVTSTPQALSNAPDTSAIPAAISDPWAAPEPEEAPAPPEPEPEPEPEPAPEPEPEPEPEPAPQPEQVAAQEPAPAHAPAPEPPRASVTQAPQPLADDPETEATPAQIADPWAAAPAAAAAPPPPDPEPAPEEAAEVAPAPPPPEAAPAPQAPPPPPAASAKTVIAPLPVIDEDKTPGDER